MGGIAGVRDAFGIMPVGSGFPKGGPGSGGRIRTYDLPINSRMLYR